jgi:hypothetical protein
MLARAASRAPSVMRHQPRSAASANVPSFDATGDSGPSLVADLGPCDDSLLACTLEPPECATDEILAVQGGCWTCADEQTCMPHHAPWIPISVPSEKPARAVVRSGSNAGSGSSTGWAGSDLGSGWSAGSGSSWGSAGGPGSGSN